MGITVNSSFQRKMRRYSVDQLECKILSIMFNSVSTVHS